MVTKKIEPDTSSINGTKERPDYEPSEMVIREIMVNKNVDRETAIKVLKNPTQ